MYIIPFFWTPMRMRITICEIKIRTGGCYICGSLISQGKMLQCKCSYNQIIFTSICKFLVVSEKLSTLLTWHNFDRQTNWVYDISEFVIEEKRQIIRWCSKQVEMIGDQLIAILLHLQIIWGKLTADRFLCFSRSCNLAPNWGHWRYDIKVILTFITKKI